MSNAQFLAAARFAYHEARIEAMGLAGHVKRHASPISKARPVRIAGVDYPSLNAAARALGTSRQQLRWHERKGRFE